MARSTRTSRQLAACARRGIPYRQTTSPATLQRTRHAATQPRRAAGNRKKRVYAKAAPRLSASAFFPAFLQHFFSGIFASVCLQGFWRTPGLCMRQPRLARAHASCHFSHLSCPLHVSACLHTLLLPCPVDACPVSGCSKAHCLACAACRPFLPLLHCACTPMPACPLFKRQSVGSRAPALYHCPLFRGPFPG